MCVKKITFVNFRFLQLGQYGGWVCCSNERVKLIDSGTIRKNVYDFLLVFCSNFVPTMHRVLRYSTCKYTVTL